MNAPITVTQLKALSEALNNCSNDTPSPRHRHLISNLAVRSPTPETPAEVNRLMSALEYLSPDVGRGNGSFFDANGYVVTDNWLAVVWAIAGLEWPSGKKIAHEWSTRCPSRFDEAGFEKAWSDYDPSHPNPVGIGSLYKLAKELGWSEQVATVQTLQPSKQYTLSTAQQLALFPPLAWAIKRVLPQQGVAAIYGPSGSGKSFLALDLGLAIAEGSRWFGNRVCDLPVVYVGLEGESGVTNRVQAWTMEHQRNVPDTFRFLLGQSFHLDDDSNVCALAAVIPKGAVIIIDTLNRAAPTADENSSQDMGRILEGAKSLQALTEGLILIVHHTGKDASRGARGHSSFFAALDAAIEVRRDASTRQRSWSIAKAKDGEDGIQHFFDLKPIHLGVDSENDSISSCVVEQVFGPSTKPKLPSGAREKQVMSTLHHCLAQPKDKGRAGAASHKPCVREDEVVNAVAGALDSPNVSKSQNVTRGRIDKLVSENYICRGIDKGEAWLWLPD